MQDSLLIQTILVPVLLINISDVLSIHDKFFVFPFSP